jgi:hypothetical protein
MEAYPDAAIPDWGDDVLVRSGRTTSRVSVTLDGNPGWIEGRVYDASTGNALAGIPVRLSIQAQAIINTRFAATLTDAEGRYRFDGLKPFPWGIWANPLDSRPDTGYLELILLDEAWTEWGTAKVVDADLEPVGFLSAQGRLVGADPDNPGNLMPLSGIRVVPVLYEWWDDQWIDYEDYAATTDEEGIFKLINLPAGQWMFYETGDETYIARFYNGWDEAGEQFVTERGETLYLSDWEVPLRNP